ncbi:iron-containing alcohol dehydrogenase [Chryseolinea sp. T2]|uniref:iron-containing alcohol dehydrogenase n=1 Tax=Chryseolinea sp. T2 TaxID=3129255 RepID=UPI003078779B
MKAYSISRTPQLHHGEGAIKLIGPGLASYTGTASDKGSTSDKGRAPGNGNALLITGSSSFEQLKAYKFIMAECSKLNIDVHEYRIPREPSLSLIDEAVVRFAEYNPQLVVGLGGGSVIDAAKAIAAMIPIREPVKDYLEGVGSKSHPGSRLPFIALPTTSGTGSEATRNAVLSEVGPQGFKRSLRHMNFVPDIAILDPELTLSCPADVTAHSGMDAFSQLLESFLSTSANPVTDALALQGLTLISHSLLTAVRDGSNIQARSDMALAAYLSGITLVNAGLGTVHGLAGVIGGIKEIPHGVICSRLMGPANVMTVRKLRITPGSDTALSRYALAGRTFSKRSGRSDDYYIDAFLDFIIEMTTTLKIPALIQYGVAESDLREFARVGDNKNNPIQLDEEERFKLLLDAWR